MYSIKYNMVDSNIINKHQLFVCCILLVDFQHLSTSMGFCPLVDFQRTQKGCIPRHLRGSLGLGPRALVGICVNRFSTQKWRLCFFSRMRSEGSRFTWGSGGEAVFAKFCVCVRNRPQPFASVRNRLRYRRKALHSGERVRRGPESVSC